MAKLLSADELYKKCDPSLLEFETTTDVKPRIGTIGQERAMRAIDFGLSLQSRGFNIFVLGESGTGKTTTIKSQVKKFAKDEPVPNDWCYVYNFKDPDVPKAITLKPGMGAEFQKDMEELVNTLKVDIPKIFESKEYERSKSSIFEKFQSRQKEMFGGLEEEVKLKGFSIRKTVSGLLIVPVSESGEPLTEEDFDALDEQKKRSVEEMGRSFQEKLDDIVRTVREEEKNVKKHLEKLERDAALSSVGHLIDDLVNKYTEYQKIEEFLQQVQEDILGHLDDFKSSEEAPSPLPFMRPPKSEPTFMRYSINVIVNNRECKGAPCVYESNPTYYNLFGRIEHKFQYGMAITDFTMIKPGALHRANGGYLIIDAMDLLRNLFSYDALKRSIRNREIKIEDVWEQYRLVSSTTLRPEALPLDVKVILIGSHMLYYMLYNLDDEYRELFKVKAEFDSSMNINGETLVKYSEFIASKCSDEQLLPFDRTGVARVVEYGSRLSGHKGKLSSRFSDVADILREAHYWAQIEQSKVVTGAHVEKALNEKIYRSSLMDDKMREQMEEDTIIVETSGARAGQVNGLAVLSMGDYMFGKPSRITAKVFAGKAGVVNIERETKMSGKIHEKAILIISNYLGSKYAWKKPITLSASITFEQLYGMIEGDSASCAELYTLISAISGAPIKQSYAVTGSMDQNGDVQPIGGVNEKIEGFFDLCRSRGLDGSHGVIIPTRNIKHLMLKKDVVDAVRDGKFTVQAIDRMEEGLEILTGMKAGDLDDAGNYPEGTINHLVMKRFEDIDKAMKPPKGAKKDEEAEQ